MEVCVGIDRLLTCDTRSHPSRKLEAGATAATLGLPNFNLARTGPNHVCRIAAARNAAR